MGSGRMVVELEKELITAFDAHAKYYQGQSRTDALRCLMANYCGLGSELRIVDGAPIVSFYVIGTRRPIK